MIEWIPVLVLPFIGIAYYFLLHRPQQQSLERLKKLYKEKAKEDSKK